MQTNATFRPAPTASAVATCGLCGCATTRGALRFSQALEEELCQTCADASQRILDAYLAAEHRQAIDFLRQLPQLTRDVLAGAEVPEFFRGI